MITLLSPAKKLNEGPALADLPQSEAAFLADTESLLKTARRLSKPKLQKLMSISENLAELNQKRFREMALPFTPENARQAVRLFAGDTYIGLDAETLAPDDVAWAQDRLRILSGLYGLLRPGDLIAPYRLEMGSKLGTRRGRDLYAFWGDRLAKAIDEALADHDEQVVVVLASQEYFKAVDREALKARVVEPVFKEDRGGTLRVISFSAKRARGAMARWIVDERIDSAAALTGFERDGYRYRDDLSDAEGEADRRIVFVRPGPDG